jgi:hypothetical protein
MKDTGVDRLVTDVEGAEIATEGAGVADALGARTAKCVRAANETTSVNTSFFASLMQMYSRITMGSPSGVVP